VRERERDDPQNKKLLETKEDIGAFTPWCKTQPPG
jgi:hypothetical protein